jgi:hypothetical protein
VIRKKLFMLMALALLITPAAIAAPGKGSGAVKSPSTAAESPNPSQTCAAQRTSMTAAVFNTTYGKNANDTNAFGKCVSQQQKTHATAKTSASAACTAEQDDTNFASTHGGKTFAEHYGKNDSDKNAFGKCVSQKAKTMVAVLSQKNVKAAKACWAQRKASPASFNAAWKNFGLCVSKDARIS